MGQGMMGSLGFGAGKKGENTGKSIEERIAKHVADEVLRNNKVPLFEFDF